MLASPIREIRIGNDRRSVVSFANKDTREYDALYSALGCSSRSELAIRAGAAVNPKDGRLIVDEHQETTVKGLFAAGDVVRGLNQISTAEGEAAVAATAMHNRLRSA